MSQSNLMALSGTYSQTCFYCHALEQDWSYGLYLPPNEADEQASDEATILYVLHGAKDAFSSYPVHSDLLVQLESRMRTGALPRTRVVFVDGFNSYYIDAPGQSVQTAFFDELMPRVEADLTLDRRHRALIGNSMGGYAALRYVIQHNDRFAFAGLLSPAIWPSVHDMAYPFHAFNAPEGREARWQALHPMRLLDALPEGALQASAFYITSGTADPAVPIEMVASAVETLKPFFHVDYAPVDGAKHDWDFWATRMGEFLDAWARWLAEN